MPRLVFEKIGNAVWISHLDLMRLFQRAFKRAGLPLKHTQGYNPRPSVSIALPLSVGTQSHCELLDFDLESETLNCDEIREKLNAALIDGIEVHQVYASGRKLRELSHLSCSMKLEYDEEIEDNVTKIQELFGQQILTVIKRTKNGPVEQNIIPMIKKLTVEYCNRHTVTINALISCQNPSLNPMQLVGAIEQYLPDLTPNYVSCSRLELYDQNEQIFR